jgi:simple sugar transport system substrate-binding protein
MRTKVFRVVVLAMVIVIAATACGPTTTTVAPATQTPVAQPPVTQPTALSPTVTPAPFIFGMLLVGTHNDSGYSNAHYDAGLYVEQHIPNSKMLFSTMSIPALQPIPD